MYLLLKFWGGKLLVIIAIIIGITSSYLLLPGTIKFIERNNKTVKNYRGKFIYNSAGIFFTLVILLICVFYSILGLIVLDLSDIHSNILVITAGVLSASFTGYLDDNSVDKAKGIIGHGKLLLKGIFTSGGIKALIGIAVSFIISLALHNKSYSLILNTLLISMMQNFINLLDLRPGRAIKAYIALSLITLPSIIFSSVFIGLNSGLIAALLFYLPYELKEKCVMGDVGSNVLGILQGIIIASSKSFLLKIIILFFIVTVQTYAEKKSITCLIEDNSLLKFIDMIGRKKHNHEYDKD